MPSILPVSLAALAWLTPTLFFPQMQPPQPVSRPISINAKCNIYAAGLSSVPELDGGGGILPVKIPLEGRTVVTLPGLKGKTSCSDAFFGPEGGECAGGDTNLEPLGPISGITHHRKTMFVVGVFLPADGQPSGPPPESLDFTGNDEFVTLSPKLGQVFFVGDAMTRPGRAGTPQKFIAPLGAGALYLGFADGFGFQGAPSYYDDNDGVITGTVRLATP
jgi:hypothetical protein